MRPELALRARRLGRLGGRDRPGVHVEGQVAEHEAHPLRVAAQQRAHDGRRLRGGGALVVPVLDERHRRRGIAAHVVARRVDGGVEHGVAHAGAGASGGGRRAG